MLPARATGFTIADPNRPAPRISRRPPSATAAPAACPVPAIRDWLVDGPTPAAPTPVVPLGPAVCPTFAACSRIFPAANRVVIPSTRPIRFGSMPKVYPFRLFPQLGVRTILSK
jgi:hypothetical protein